MPNKPPRRTGPRRWGAGLAKAALTVAVTWLILRGAGFRLAEVRAIDLSVFEPDIPFLALSAVVLLAAFTAQAWLWSRILEDFGESRVPLPAATGMILVANLGRYIPGKIFQLAGLAALARRAGLSAARAGAAAVTGQVLHLLGAAVIGGWVAYGSPDFPKGVGLVTGSAILLALAGFLYFGGAGALLDWALRRSGHTGELPRSSRLRLLLWLGGYLLSWLIYGLAFFCLSLGAGLEVPLATATTAFAGAYLIGYIVLIAPAGIGVRESSLVFFLTPVLGPDASLVLAALQRVWITTAELAGAAAGAILIRKPSPKT